MKKFISQKVDRADFDQAINLKANKVDMMRSLRNIEVIHSQLSHVLVLFIEFIRLLGIGPEDSERYESDK